MTNGRCYKCGTKTKKIQSQEICPNCGVILDETESELEETNYIG